MTGATRRSVNLSLSLSPQTDKGFDKTMFERQMSVMRGQVSWKSIFFYTLLSILTLCCSCQFLFPFSLHYLCPLFMVLWIICSFYILLLPCSPYFPMHAPLSVFSIIWSVPFYLLISPLLCLFRSPILILAILSVVLHPDSYLCFVFLSSSLWPALLCNQCLHAMLCLSWRTWAPCEGN